jgi:hypothetical protein
MDSNVTIIKFVLHMYLVHLENENRPFGPVLRLRLVSRRWRDAVHTYLLHHSTLLQEYERSVPFGLHLEGMNRLEAFFAVARERCVSYCRFARSLFALVSVTPHGECPHNAAWVRLLTTHYREDVVRSNADMPLKWFRNSSELWLCEHHLHRLQNHL